MSRSFTANDLIQLPILGASDAVVLITQLLTAASAAPKPPKSKELPPSIERSRTRLGAAHVALNEVIAPKAEGDTLVKRKADRRIDGAWSAGFDWLSGWCKLPLDKNPHLDESKALMALVFPDALSFTKLPYKIEWQESKSRLDAIEREEHDRTFKLLGGAVFLENIKEAQEAYGAALHITVTLPVEVTGEVRSRLTAALAAVRDYVNRVSAHAEPDVPGTEALAEALLLPLAVWETTHPAASSTADAPPPGAPTAPAPKSP